MSFNTISPLPWLGEKNNVSGKYTQVPVNAEVSKLASTAFSAGIVIWGVPSAALTVAGASVAVAVGLLVARIMRTYAQDNQFTKYSPFDAVLLVSAGISGARFAGLTIGIVPYTAAYLMSEVLTSIILGEC